MTEQEVFDIAVSGILKQGVKSKNPETDVCLYRGPNNTKCAAGFLIPDDKYDSSFEDQRWAAISYKFPEYEASASIISDLQCCHDRGSENWDDETSSYIWDVNKFKDNTKAVAKRYNLEWKY